MTPGNRQCIACGCTNNQPCIDDETGEACAWVPIPTGPGTTVMQINGGGLCSFCAEQTADEAPGVQIYTDAEANQFLKSRGAGR